MQKFFLFLILLILVAFNVNSESSWKLSSVDGKVKGKIKLNENGNLSFNLSYLGEKVLNNSPLGIAREDEMFENFVLLNAGRITKKSEEYMLISGKNRHNKIDYHELIIELENLNGSRLDVVFRAYNEGFAFRYIFPTLDNELKIVTHELTAFNIPKGNAWLQPYDTISPYSPAYERNWEGPLPVGSLAPGDEGWCFPALFEINDRWLLLTESDLSDNFFGSHLKQKFDNPNIYSISPPEEEEGFGYGNNLAMHTLPWEMPWRVMITGDCPGDILESNLTTHLASPSIIQDQSWIIPGRASWGWWSGFLDGTNDTPEKLKKFIDFASEMGWEYSLVDAGWDTRPGLDLETLVNYADSKKVKLLLWYNAGGPVNRVNAGPRDLMYDREVRRAEMKRISNLGISGIKVDFFSSDKQDFIKLYLDILKDAADFQLTVNFHGSTIPRGWTRTYPHLLTMESVKGAEGYIYHSDFEKKGPVHKAILPFTRNVIGPMDYTPVAFSQSFVPHRTTYGFQLALAVLFESGIQHFPDQVEKYLSLPIEVIEFLKELPVVWDDTRYLKGYPGREVVLARKYEDDWYIAGINAEKIDKEFSLDFSFLDNNLQWDVMIISDGLTKNEFLIDTRLFNINRKININVLPVGGFVMKITPSAIK